MVDNTPPSRDPANDDSMTGMLREVLKKSLQNTDDMLPAVVEVYDRTTNRARVRPLVTLLTTDNTLVPRASIPSIPVLLLGGGSFFVSFHLPEGSLGWIKASDRDISLFLASYAEDKPGTRRLHSFEDAVFIPDVMTGYTIDPEDEQAMVIQNLDGTVRMSLTSERVRVTSPIVEIVTGTTTVTNEQGTTTIDAANLQVNGDINVTGTVTADIDVVGGGVSLNSHTHTGSPTAPNGPVSNTGGPV